jgi:hypothetical protein
MREGRGRGSDRSGAQLVVAVFDDWDALLAILVGMETDMKLRPAVVLHARNDIPAKAAAFSSLRQTTELRFERSRQQIACTVGWLAGELSVRLAKGARSLADALHDWVDSDRAGQLESHVEKGRFLLCVELRTSEDFSIVCGRLAKASPHMVELWNVEHHRHEGVADDLS